MLPFAYEWHWDIGHIIFFGLFYLALTVISLGVLYVVGSTLKDYYKGLNPHDVHHGHDEHGEEQGEASGAA